MGVLPLKALPTPFVGIVYAADEETALAVAIR
jgi:hypothetical protein